MRVGFHPVADNPVRMAYVPRWKSVSTLIQRLDELDQVVHGGTVIPATWEPFYSDCPSSRNAREYAWARGQLQSPSDFAVALAMFPEDDKAPSSDIGRANWMLLRAKGEASHVTHKYMVLEAVELWEAHATAWFQQIVEACAALGIETNVAHLAGEVQQWLTQLQQAVLKDAGAISAPTGEVTLPQAHGFNKELMQLDGWSRDPGTIRLPVDGIRHSLTSECLLMNLQHVVLLKGKHTVRSAKWEKVTLVYLYNEALTFQIADEEPIVVSGYKHPEQSLKIVQECYRAATERILQAIAAQVPKQPRP